MGRVVKALGQRAGDPPVRDADLWPPRHRGGGVLLHPSSFPSGRLGADAFAFVDWLVRAQQSFWQVLPLTPPDASGSPYSSVSAFAGSPLLLGDPDRKISRHLLRAFRERHRYWIDDWATYDGGPEAIADQVRFEREWLELRRYANGRGVRIIGDVPIYVARDSADVAAHPSLFDTTRAAGVPPDAFSETGQLWGNPLHSFGSQSRDGYRWWIERFRRMLQLVDVPRVDHFRGFVAYWAVAGDATIAGGGRWCRGPGLRLFKAVHDALGPLPLVAEDLGVITPAVNRLRDDIGALGMQVLQFGFASRVSSHHPSRHRELSVVYTGTHDHPPAAGWWQHAAPVERVLLAEALELAQIDPDDPSWALIRLAHASRARIAVVQLQDVLGLGDEGRMNRPAGSGANWSWRLRAGELTADHAEQLRAATVETGRAGADRRDAVPHGRLPAYPRRERRSEP